MIYISFKINTWSLHPKHLPQLIKRFRVVGSKKARLQLFQCSFGRGRDDVITHSLTCTGENGTARDFWNHQVQPVAIPLHSPFHTLPSRVSGELVLLLPLEGCFISSRLESLSNPPPFQTKVIHTQQKPICSCAPFCSCGNTSTNGSFPLLIERTRLSQLTACKPK